MLMKTRLLLNIISATFIAGVSCNKEDSIQPLSVYNQSNITPAHFIGEHFGGGIIFYLDNKKKHGIIAANEDFEEAAVWSRKATLNGASGVKIGAGAANSNHIFKTQGSPEFDDEYAALQCINLIENGYTDWYLPSKDDLNQMYLHKDVIPNLKPFAYWSSTEVNKTTAWFQNFGNGAQVQQAKNAGYAARAVRYF